METKQALDLSKILMQRDVKAEISKSISVYAALGIDISIVGNDGKTLTVLIEQKRLINGHILNNKQLYDRARDVFYRKNCKDFCGYRVVIKPVVYSLQVSDITIEWIEQKKQEFGLTNKDLIKQLAIDKSSLSLILSGTRELSKPMRATFFYYFLTYELNRDFREQF